MRHNRVVAIDMGKMMLKMMPLRIVTLKLCLGMAEFDSIEALLKTHLPPDALAQVESVLYGKKADNVELPQSVQERADQGHFQVKAVKFSAAPMQRTAPRIVKIALIQNAIKAPTTSGIEEQYSGIEAAVELMLDAAAEGGANICCLQEAWTAPFFFCTREKQV
jgi:beta-ureidopropionase